MELLFFWCLYLSSFLLKKEAVAKVFFCEFCKFSKNTFLTEFLWATTFDF